MIIVTSNGDDLESVELYDTDKDIFFLPDNEEIYSYLYRTNEVMGKFYSGMAEVYYNVIDKSLVYLLDKIKYLKCVLSGRIKPIDNSVLLEDPTEFCNYKPNIICLEKVRVKDGYYFKYDMCNGEYLFDSRSKLFVIRLGNYFGENAGSFLVDGIYGKKFFMQKSVLLYKGRWKLCILCEDTRKVALIDLFALGYEDSIEIVDEAEFYETIDFERYFDKERF